MLLKGACSGAVPCTMPSDKPPQPPPANNLNLQATRLGALWIDPAQHPQRRVHLSAASGLVRSGKSLFVVADDELHLGVFDDTLAAGMPPPPGSLLRLLEGDLPQDPVQRKKLKPDLETLALLPPLPGCVGGALLVLGSGSKSNREIGVLVALGGPGKTNGRMAKVDLKPWYAPLRKRFADLNIEGAWVSSGELLLLHRGNKSDVRSACIRYDWNLVAPWLAGLQPQPPAAKSVQVIALGAVNGIPLSLTDGAGLPDGEWMFSAVAEDTRDNVNDGACVGSAVGIVGADGQVRLMFSLQGAPKVEGIAVQRDADDWVVTMVTDPDDATVASQWLSVRWPLAQVM